MRILGDGVRGGGGWEWMYVAMVVMLYCGS